MVGAVANPLFDAYLVPFEIASVLLLAAIVGAVVLAKRKTVACCSARPSPFPRCSSRWASPACCSGANVIVIFMCVELMLNAVNLTFVRWRRASAWAARLFVFFVMAVAAAEAAVGLAIILAVYRHKQSVSLQNMNLLKDG